MTTKIIFSSFGYFVEFLSLKKKLEWLNKIKIKNCKVKLTILSFNLKVGPIHMYEKSLAICTEIFVQVVPFPGPAVCTQKSRLLVPQFRYT